MCKGLDDLMARNRREGKASMIRTALQGGSTPEAIAKVMCISIDEVKAMINQNESKIE